MRNRGETTRLTGDRGASPIFLGVPWQADGRIYGRIVHAGYKRTLKMSYRWDKINVMNSAISGELNASYLKGGIKRVDHYRSIL